MNCADFSEYVSALCDGEIIPPSAAGHIGHCPSCQSRLRDYLEMGAELRRAASLDYAASVPPLPFAKPQNRLSTWWQKGLATMRIPRLAFVVLIASVVALASSLAVVKVRARSTGTVVLLSISAGGEKPVECALSTVDKRWQLCGFIGSVGNEFLGYKIRLLSRSDDRVQLGMSVRDFPLSPGKSVGYGLNDIDTPEQQVWFEPGDTLKIDNLGLPTFTLTGTWMDHVPSFIGASQMDPGPDEIRIMSPLLLQGKEVVGDMKGGYVSETKPNMAVFISFPKEGRYLISNSRLQGAIEAEVDLNRISFEESGQQYVLLTGTPVTRASHVWVLHLPPNPLGRNGDHAGIGGQGLRETSPGLWVPQKPMD